MATQIDRKPQPVSPAPLAADPGAPFNEADNLLERAREVQEEQAVAVGISPLESQYTAALAAEVEAKHDQAERIEDRLEHLIEQQASRMQMTQAAQPGLLTLPGTRAKWQATVQQQQASMLRLQGRLELVREIKDGMSIHGPKLDELASRKLRHKEPELAEGWDELREAQRLHQAHLRKLEQEKKHALEREQRQGVGAGLGRSLGLSQSLTP